MNFPAAIDNSMRKAFSECPTRFMRRYCQNLVVPEPNVDLHFGACFARGIEVARKGCYSMDGYHIGNIDPIENGIAASTYAWSNFQSPPMSNKTLPRLIGALRYYFEQWPLGEEGLTPVENGIEKSFTIELPIAHPETGLPMQYCGRFDMLATDSNDRYYIVDEKTTGKLGDAWYSKWDLDSQMSGYIWATKQEVDAEVMAQVRGVSILKNDYGHVEVPIVRSEWALKVWHEQLMHDIERMIVCWKSKWWDKALNDQCTAYGRACDYKKLCMSPSPERLIEGNYKVEVWNPLERK